MSSFAYVDAPVAIRDDIPAAHRRAWERLAAPGTWWTGAERVAIAAEVRNAQHCALCRARKRALSPSAVAGQHEHLDALPEAAIDVIHRVASDPGRLSEAWCKEVLTGLSEEQYVELIGVVVSVVSIDSLHRGLGVPLEPLPEPTSGEPLRKRPASAQREAAWVSMIPSSAVGGEESDLWPKGRTGNVVRALSLVPAEVRGLKELSAAHYLGMDEMMDLEKGRSLDRRQIELIAGRVSALNECFY